MHATIEVAAFASVNCSKMIQNDPKSSKMIGLLNLKCQAV